MVRINDDLPAPLGPRRPNIPLFISRLMLFSAFKPFEYVFERFVILSCILENGFMLKICDE
jgi:hypothetical protein